MEHHTATIEIEMKHSMHTSTVSLSLSHVSGAAELSHICRTAHHWITPIASIPIAADSRWTL